MAEELDGLMAIEMVDSRVIEMVAEWDAQGVEMTAVLSAAKRAG